MKNITKLVSIITLVCLVVGCFAGCQDGTLPDESTVPSAPVVSNEDYVASLKLEMNSATLKQEVTVKSFIDGDTTHFNVPADVMETGVLKARYLAVNTPESTGKIEEYGKKAAAFTKEKLSSATSIIIESDDDKWNADSTGGRYLVWVWYKTAESEDYRNLNLEILQNGLAIASSTSNNRYGGICTKALNQAKAQKLNVHSGQKDPDFYYGEAVELTLKELRTNIEAYNGMKVAFNGVITKNNAQTVYVEDYDEETGLYYGMAVYYGYNLTGTGLEILTVGNEVRIVGSVQYYETGGTWQVADVSYRMMKPDDPSNLQKISEGNAPAYVPTDANTFLTGKVEIETEEEVKTFDYANLAMSTSVEMKNLKVVDVYTTQNEGSESNGAMTLTCEVDGVMISVRTVRLVDANGELVTADAYMGKTIDVRGIVDYYSGAYQIKVFTVPDITVH